MDAPPGAMIRYDCGVEIRRLGSADAAQYRALMLRAYEEHPDAFTSSAGERAALPLTWWQERLTDEPSARQFVWGGFRDGALTGAVGLALEEREKTAHKATVFGMYVTPESRRMGAGDRLVQVLVSSAGSRPELRMLVLSVSEGNRGARALYERHGFRVYGVEPLAVRVGETFVAKVLMWREL